MDFELKLMDFVLKMMDFELKLMEFSLNNDELIYFVLKLTRESPLRRRQRLATRTL